MTTFTVLGSQFELNSSVFAKRSVGQKVVRLMRRPLDAPRRNVEEAPIGSEVQAYEV
jgi:hypothetical protein